MDKEKESNHSRVKERLEMAVLVIAFINEIYNAIPMLIDLFNVAFNYPSKDLEHT